MISACAFVTPSARAAATTARFTISAIEAAVIAAAPILPCRVTDRNTGPSVIPDRSIQARARRTLRGRHGPPHTAEPAKLVDDGFIAIPLMALPGRAPAGPAGNANGVSRGRLIGIEAINGDEAVVHELRQFGRVGRAAPPEEGAGWTSVPRRRR